MRRSSVLLDPRKAVEFSERQMHDIENIAANLIRSLKHMRSIVDESLSSEALALLHAHMSDLQIQLRHCKSPYPSQCNATHGFLQYSLKL
jgi:hypothetical protein